MKSHPSVKAFLVALFLCFPGMRLHAGTPAISAGGTHSQFLKSDGTVWAMGRNSEGQLGDGTPSDHSTPVQVMTGDQSISAGGYHSLFLKTDGTAWVTGLLLNSDDSSVKEYSPFEVMSGVQAISAGGNHSLFLKTDGTVWATGRNSEGQLGDGTTSSRSTPVQVLSGVQAISAGSYHSLFLKTDGSVWATGSDGYGQFGDGNTGFYVSTPVQVMSGVQAISAGGNHSLFLKTDGTAWATGDNTSAQFGSGIADKSTPVQVFQLIAYQPTAWQQAQFGPDAYNPLISGWAADPDHDGIDNLLERAFNLPPLQASTTTLTANTGSTGLPWITSTQDQGGPFLTIQYIRLKASTNSGLTYTPQFSSSLDDNAWSAATGTETVESIDADWERVTVTDAMVSPPAIRFGRVKVSSMP